MKMGTTFKLVFEPRQYESVAQINRISEWLNHRDRHNLICRTWHVYDENTGKEIGNGGDISTMPWAAIGMGHILRVGATCAANNTDMPKIKKLFGNGNNPQITDIEIKE